MSLNLKKRAIAKTATKISRATRVRNAFMWVLLSSTRRTGSTQIDIVRRAVCANASPVHRTATGRLRSKCIDSKALSISGARQVHGAFVLRGMYRREKDRGTATLPARAFASWRATTGIFTSAMSGTPDALSMVRENQIQQSNGGHHESSSHHIGPGNRHRLD